MQYPNEKTLIKEDCQSLGNLTEQIEAATANLTAKQQEQVEELLQETNNITERLRFELLFCFFAFFFIFDGFVRKGVLMNLFRFNCCKAHQSSVQGRGTFQGDNDKHDLSSLNPQ